MTRLIRWIVAVQAAAGSMALAMLALPNNAPFIAIDQIFAAFVIFSVFFIAVFEVIKFPC